MAGPPRASAQYAASRFVWSGWKPWLKAWLTTSSAMTRSCQARASRRSPSVPPAASNTVTMATYSARARISAKASARSSRNASGSVIAAGSRLTAMQHVPWCEVRAIIAAAPGSGANG